jgi:hypothetical protein
VVSYQLARPVKDNKTALKAKFPGAVYKGDIGDPSHLSKAGDHTPYSADRIFGQPMRRGFVYAQDLGGGGSLVIAEFARWLLDAVRGNEYPEIKYVITRHPVNRNRDGGRYYGLFDRRYSWRTQFSSGHDSHIHISYMPGFENRDSTLIADYHDELNGLLAKRPVSRQDPVLRHWKDAPPLVAPSLRRYSHVPLNKLPCIAYPPMVKGYGGPDSPAAQSDFATAIFEYAQKQCRTTMITPEEIKRAEFGSGFLSWARMVAIKAGNPWINDPISNGKSLGAAIGAPAHW